MKTLRLPQITVTETTIDDECARYQVSIPSLNIDEYGTYPESAVCAALSSIATLWHEFVCHPVEELAPDAIALREKLLAMFVDERMAAECKLRGTQGLRVGKRVGRPTNPVRD